MPFLFLLGAQAVDEPRLVSRLCPYRGPLSQRALAGGRLYTTSLAGERTIPATTRRNPQTSWLAFEADDSSVRFTTDPLGTFPLWIAALDGGGLAVTGEVKALTAIDGFTLAFDPEAWPADRKRPPDYTPYRNVHRVMPGATLHVAPDGAHREEGRAPLVYQPTEPLDGDARAEALDAALRASAAAIAAAGPAATADAGAGDRWGALLSGGIDSSMATALLHRHHPDLRTYTLGTEHGDEYADAAELASHLAVPHTRVFATTDLARAHFERATFANETVDGLTAETLAQLSILCTAAARDVRRVVTGYGADLLFGSMLRHALYLQVTGVDDLQSLIERTMWSGEFSPFYAWSLGVEVHHLFWDPDVMNTAFRIPPEASFDGTHEKRVMRDLAVARGHLQHAHAYRKKQALTDGTQFNRTLSTALGLPDRHAYGGKNARAIAVLRDFFDSSEHPPPTGSL